MEKSREGRTQERNERGKCLIVFLANSAKKKRE